MIFYAIQKTRPCINSTNICIYLKQNETKQKRVSLFPPLPLTRFHGDHSSSEKIVGEGDGAPGWHPPTKPGLASSRLGPCVEAAGSVVREGRVHGSRGLDASACIWGHIWSQSLPAERELRGPELTGSPPHKQPWEAPGSLGLDTSTARISHAPTSSDCSQHRPTHWLHGVLTMERRLLIATWPPQRASSCRVKL